MAFMVNIASISNHRTFIKRVRKTPALKSKRRLIGIRYHQHTFLCRRIAIPFIVPRFEMPPVSLRRSHNDADSAVTADSERGAAKGQACVGETGMGLSTRHPLVSQVVVARNKRRTTN